MDHNDVKTHSRDEQADGPPDHAASGDVSTTGVSSNDIQDTGGHGAHDDSGVDSGHGGQGGHGDDAAEVSTLVPTNWKQLILPALILLLVGILVAGPLFGAFATRPTSPEQNSVPGQATATPGHEGSAPATDTAVSPQAASSAEPILPNNTATSLALNPGSIATRTAVAIAGEQGEVARLPVQLEFGGASFIVKPGSNLLPDWKPPQDLGIATWIEGTVANHIMYVPYNNENAALFQAVKQGATIHVTMNTGQVYVFAVTRSERAANGPATSDGQFTVTTAMRQDHAGVTLFLIGDPADDRAVVQADFTGTIQ
ncbi:MAG: hypothetical protein ABIO92_02270 [Chloroflexia bacterium]